MAQMQKYTGMPGFKQEWRGLQRWGRFARATLFSTSYLFSNIAESFAKSLKPGFIRFTYAPSPPQGSE